MTEPETPSTPPAADPLPVGIRDDWDGISSDGVTLVSTDASPEQIAKTLGVTLDPTPPAGPPPEVAPEPPVRATPAPAAATPSGTEPEPPAAEPPRPKGKRTPEQRIAQAQYDLRQAEARERQALDRATDLERQLQAATAAVTPPAASAPAATPVATETFPTWEAWSADPAHEGQAYEEYQDARSDWRAAKRGLITRAEAEQIALEKAEALRAQDAADRATAERAERAETLRQAFLLSREQAKTTHEDYLQVVEESDLRTNATMDGVIERAGPLAGELMYYLGSHPEECQRIAALRIPAEVIEAMTRIKITLEGAPVTGPSPSVRPVTRAPAPPEPVGSGRSTSAATLLSDPRTSFAEFMRIRNEQERAAASGL